jgi:hypothetical protein
VAGITSEWWPASVRNGGRLQIGIPAGIKSEYLAGMRRNLQYVRGSVHTNTVEGFFSILKRGVYGVYQHVSEAHLHRYLNEFDLRYSNRIKLGIDDVKRADLAIEGARGKRLTYQTTRSEGQNKRPKRPRFWRGKRHKPDPDQLELPFDDATL